MVLDIDLGKNYGCGSTVYMHPKHGGENQQWIMNSDGTISNPISCRVLDIDSHGHGNNGTKVQLWDKINSPNQKWQLERAY
jgi:hypothetical protein